MKNLAILAILAAATVPAFAQTHRVFYTASEIVNELKGSEDQQAIALGYIEGSMDMITVTRQVNNVEPCRMSGQTLGDMATVFQAWVISQPKYKDFPAAVVIGLALCSETK